MAFFESNKETPVVSWKESALALLEKYRERANQLPGGFGLKKEKGYREIVEKDKGRFDLNLDHIDDFQGGNPDTCFISEVRRHAEAKIRPLLVEMFGDKYALNGKGVVVSFPGTAPQEWHVDSSHLFTAQQLGTPDVCRPLVTIPSHFVTVFVPLYRARPELGPTEFLTGSAPYTYILQNSEVQDQYPPSAVVEKIRPLTRPATMRCNPGDVIVMDGRTLHRGLANLSTEVRPLCYFSFCPPWYREWPRSQNEGRSLFVP